MCCRANAERGAGPYRGYQPIGDYAIIGDCRTAALISRQGSLDWLCLPHFSGAAVFGALLDCRRGGRFLVRPAIPFDTQRRYLGETNVLETTFATDRGTLRVLDCMPILAGSGLDKRLRPANEVLRILECAEGEVEAEIAFEPRPDYARARGVIEPRGGSSWVCQHRDELLLLRSDLPLQTTFDGTGLHGWVRLSAGRRHYLSLSYVRRDVGIIVPLGAAADRRLESTLAWWRAWSGQCDYKGPYRPAVIRSVLALKLLTHALSGAVIAAATTSLPETIGGVRNWDYRFCWLRDAALTLSAFLDLGYRDEGEKFLAWLLHATRLTWPRLQVMYDVYGETRLPEHEMDHFDGYRGSRPVRIGNEAADQRQLDVYGAVLLAAHAYIGRGGRLTRVERRVLSKLGRSVVRCWREPDDGIWELRGQRQHTTYSKLMCWAALNCLISLHEAGHLRVPLARLRRERDEIRRAIESHGFNRRLNSYVATFDGDEPDASLLLMDRCGYRQSHDPRMRCTYRFIERELSRNGLMLRYPDGFDGLPGMEGAFGIASFWAVEHLARCGQIDEARVRFERLVSLANDVGLYAEEFDRRSGEPLGNFPQAFTHVGLISAALSLSRRASRREAALSAVAE
jgi:GH15 family glucan-1,4-alpha-glucosidase